MRYRRRVTTIEAEQYNGDVVRGICQDPKCFINLESSNSHHVHIIHNNQPVQVEAGDFVIPEPDGIHFYPCKPDIFQAGYEPVEEELSFPQPNEVTPAARPSRGNPYPFTGGVDDDE